MSQTQYQRDQQRWRRGARQRSAVTILLLVVSLAVMAVVTGRVGS